MPLILLIYERHINNTGISNHIPIGTTKALAEIIYRIAKAYQKGPGLFYLGAPKK